MKYCMIVFIATGLLLASTSGWSASTKQEIKELKAQVAEVQVELAEIKKLLQESARAPRAAAAPAGFNPQTITVGTSPVKGKIDAPVTVIEYSDYDCPFCARNFRDVMPLLQQEYIDTGKVRFVMRENPLISLHKDAMNASMAALCAGDQSKYWEMHDVLFANQKKFTLDNLKGFAGELGLDTGAFNECLDSKKHEKTVQADLASGAKLGVQGTPGFVIGKTDPADPDKVNATVFIKGAQPIDQFRASINDLLGSDT